MPNWCYTTLQVKGPESEIRTFLEGLIQKDEQGNTSPDPGSILAAWAPMPPELMIDHVVVGATPEQEAQYAANRAKHGAPTWYEWCLQHYGSKWPDCDTTILERNRGEVWIRFNTAWSPVVPGIERVSERFPRLVFTMSYQEEGGEYVGAAVIKDGRVRHTSTGEPHRPTNEVVDGNREFTSEDDYFEAYQDAIDAMEDEHREMAGLIAQALIETEEGEDQ